MRPQRWLRDSFFAGLAIVLPVALSIFLFVWIVETITGRVAVIITESWLKIDTGEGAQTGDTGQPAKGTEGAGKVTLSPTTMFFLRVVILIAMVIATVLIGRLARTFLGRQFVRLGDMILERIPLFNRIYIVLRQISQSMLNEKSDMFSAVVLVEFPRAGLQSVGFITGRFKGETEGETKSDVYTVFVPTTPNPTTGFMLVATEDQFERLNLTIEEGMKMVISGGVVLPEAHKFLPERERFLAALSRGSSKGKG